MSTPTIFRDNPYDLAGMADFPHDEEALTPALRRIASWLSQETLVADDDLYTTVLYAFLRVGQLDYRDGTFWEFLASRLGCPVDPIQQRRLGEWFRDGLRRFEYHVPADGLTNVTPILVHAGVPRSSVLGLV